MSVLSCDLNLKSFILIIIIYFSAGGFFVGLANKLVILNLIQVNPYLLPWPDLFQSSLYDFILQNPKTLNV